MVVGLGGAVGGGEREGEGGHVVIGMAGVRYWRGDFDRGMGLEVDATC